MALAASDPIVAPGAAQVLIRAMWVSKSARQPVSTGVFLVTLVCDGNDWRATEIRTLVIS
jgi:hypothetical protein